MNSARPLLLAGLLLATTDSSGFESDVHYGLTQWLARQAGFDEQSAETIATGDQRVDSGDMQYLELVLAYACVGQEDLGSRLTGEHHYPSAGTVPGPPAARAVLPGGDAAKKAALTVVKVPAGQANYMLFRLGEALHILQDSWSHQGVPDTPQPGGAFFRCDSTRAWGHPATRGGWNSHKADLTMHWPADTRAMAKATYEVLTQYPILSDARRTARSWEEIRPLLDGFITASTKTEKKRWFVSQSISDVSFLEGISLRDGAQPFDLKRKGRKRTGSIHSRHYKRQCVLIPRVPWWLSMWILCRQIFTRGPKSCGKCTKRLPLPSNLLRKEEIESSICGQTGRHLFSRF